MSSKYINKSRQTNQQTKKNISNLNCSQASNDLINSNYIILDNQYSFKNIYISKMTIFKEYDHRPFQYFSKSLKPQIELVIEPHEIYQMNIEEIKIKEDKYTKTKKKKIFYQN